MGGWIATRSQLLRLLSSRERGQRRGCRSFLPPFDDDDDEGHVSYVREEGEGVGRSRAEGKGVETEKKREEEFDDGRRRRRQEETTTTLKAYDDRNEERYWTEGTQLFLPSSEEGVPGGGCGAERAVWTAVPEFTGQLAPRRRTRRRRHRKPAEEGTAAKKASGGSASVLIDANDLLARLAEEREAAEEKGAVDDDGEGEGRKSGVEAAPDAAAAAA